MKPPEHFRSTITCVCGRLQLANAFDAVIGDRLERWWWWWRRRDGAYRSNIRRRARRTMSESGEESDGRRAAKRARCGESKRQVRQWGRQVGQRAQRDKDKSDSVGRRRTTTAISTHSNGHLAALLQYIADPV